MFGIVLPLDLILSFLLYLTGKPEKNDQLCCNNLALIEILERNGTNIEPILLAQKGVSLTFFGGKFVDLIDSSSMWPCPGSGRADSRKSGIPNIFLGFFMASHIPASVSTVEKNYSKDILRHRTILTILIRIWIFEGYPGSDNSISDS